MSLSLTNYEAWYGEEQIYNGASKKEMVRELLDFIDYNNYDGFDSVLENDIESLNKKVLNNIGIKLYYAKW